MAWRVNGETVLMLGAGRALLMQLAHPAVAAGVAEHSGFPDDAFRRLFRTLDTMLAITFGDTEQSRRAAERVNGLHGRIRGDAYDALDPKLLLWVHATLVDSALLVHDRFVGTLTPSDRDRYYRDMKRQAVELRVPSSVLPGSLGDFERYVRKQVAGLEVTEEARRLARAILAPPVPLPIRPVGAAFGLITAALLPEPVRAGYGLRRRPAVEAALGTAAALSRGTLPLVPAVFRTWPAARAARARVAAAR